MGAAIAFLAGLGQGYLGAKANGERQRKDDEDRALRNETTRLQLEQLKQQQSDQRTLREAGKPMTMAEGAGGMLKPDTMDNRDVGQPENADLPDQGLQQGAFNVGGKPFADRTMAGAELATQNTPEARTQRVMAAMSGIDPLKALDLEHQQTQRGRETTKFSQEQQAYAKKLKDEGAIDALKALRMGDGPGMVAAFNAGGNYKIEGEPVLTQEPRNVPGVGAVPSYTATFQVRDKDGNLKPMTVNSHDTSMSLMPYEKYLDENRAGKKEDREGRETDSKINLQGAMARNYDAAATATTSGIGKPGKAEKAPLFERMDEIDKMQFKDLQEQRSHTQKEITKALASGTLDEKSPVLAQFRAQIASYNLKEQALLQKYAGTDAAPAADPAGLRAPAKPATPPPAQPVPVKAPAPAANMAMQTPAAAPAQRPGGRPSVAQAMTSTPVPAPVPALVGAAPINMPAPAGQSPQAMGDDFQSAPARAALTQRVQEATAGGAPLSPVELLRARQLGLIG
jgi:hypothetical protein